MNNKRLILSLVVILLLLSACKYDVLKETTIDSFAFTNQYGESFGTKNLDGNVWVANFFFTNCTTVCPLLTTEMAQLQEVFDEQNLDVTLVSFTVDPENDTPYVLKQYIKQYTDDDTNWHLLTGYKQEDIERFAREQFQTIVQKPKSSNQVIHSSTIYLIDQQGRIVDEYHISDESYKEDIITQIKKVQ